MWSPTIVLCNAGRRVGAGVVFYYVGLRSQACGLFVCPCGTAPPTVPGTSPTFSQGRQLSLRFGDTRLLWGLLMLTLLLPLWAVGFAPVGPGPHAALCLSGTRSSTIRAKAASDGGTKRKVAAALRESKEGVRTEGTSCWASRLSESASEPHSFSAM